MQYFELNPHEGKEGIEKVTQISVSQGFDPNQRVKISKELLNAIRARGDVELLASYLAGADADDDVGQGEGGIHA